MMRSAWFSVAVLATGACASGGGTPLIMDRSIAQEVRTAGTCYAFNKDADRYVFGLQAEMEDYDEAAAFWGALFETVEPNARQRERLLSSARKGMDEDFPRRTAPQSTDQVQNEVVNLGYGTVITMCKSERTKLEAENG